MISDRNGKREEDGMEEWKKAVNDGEGRSKEEKSVLFLNQIFKRKG